MEQCHQALHLRFTKRRCHGTYDNLLLSAVSGTRARYMNMQHGFQANSEARSEESGLQLCKAKDKEGFNGNGLHVSMTPGVHTLCRLLAAR